MKDKIQITEGDITKQAVDAIVNAANTSLLGGGGVDGAIHRAAGPELLEETKRIGGCPTGEARISRGYRLPAKWVIHTVGPIWSGGANNEDELLAECYRNCFKASKELKISSIAFPAISTGVYRFPLSRATEIAMKETRNFLQGNGPLQKVLFVCFDKETLLTYERVFEKIFETLS